MRFFLHVEQDWHAWRLSDGTEWRDEKGKREKAVFSNGMVQGSVPVILFWGVELEHTHLNTRGATVLISFDMYVLNLQWLNYTLHGLCFLNKSLKQFKTVKLSQTAHWRLFPWKRVNERPLDETPIMDMVLNVHALLQMVFFFIFDTLLKSLTSNAMISLSLPTVLSIMFQATFKLYLSWICPKAVWHCILTLDIH